MTVNIDISSDIEQVIEEVDEFFRKDIPFAFARAMNDTMFDVRARVTGPTFDKAFNVRNNRFPRILWRVDTIRTGGPNAGPFREFKAGVSEEMTVTLRQVEERDYILDHVQGGTKTPRGSSIAIPRSPEALRTKTGRISKRNKPITITNRKDTFLVKDKSGRKRFIARRKNKNLEIIYSFKQTAKIDKRFRFYEDAFDTVDRVALRYFGHHFAVITSKSRFT